MNAVLTWSGPKRKDGRAKHPLYECWSSMRKRCLKKWHRFYESYGGRGITIDPMWDDFWVFAFDMGPKPSPEHSLDRIDNDGNYTPENCRWATTKQQHTNTRHTHRLEHDGIVDSLRGWADRLGTSHSALAYRIKSAGLSIALSGQLLRKRKCI